MIVDSSALVAIVFEESDAARYTAATLRSDSLTMAAPNYLEVCLVVDARRRDDLSSLVDRLIEKLDITIAPFTADQARIARDASRRYGRGSGHPAKLNFGDCIAYSLAIERGEPLLFKGNDFAQTDVVPAIPPTR